VLSTAALWAQGTQNKGQGGFDARLGNSIRYDSPTSKGFTGAVQYSARDSSGNADGAAGDNGDHPSELSHARVWSLGGLYSGGPIDLGVAYERNDRVRAVGRHDDAFSISGAYDFGEAGSVFSARVALIYERLKYDTLDGNLKRDFYGISANVPVGGGWIYAFWGHASDGKGTTADGTQVGLLTKGPGTASDQWELSYTYNLSLRSMVYAGYVRINNRANAAYTFNINDYEVAPGAKPSGFVLGMAHFFWSPGIDFVAQGRRRGETPWSRGRIIRPHRRTLDARPSSIPAVLSDALREFLQADLAPRDACARWRRRRPISRSRAPRSGCVPARKAARTGLAGTTHRRRTLSRARRGARGVVARRPPAAGRAPLPDAVPRHDARCHGIAR
jgi:hypothetical protein